MNPNVVHDDFIILYAFIGEDHIQAGLEPLPSYYATRQQTAAIHVSFYMYHKSSQNSFAIPFRIERSHLKSYKRVA